VMWELDEQGRVHGQWTGKTVIRSCAQLAYEHAQDMIDGKFAARAGEKPPAGLAEPHRWSEVRAASPCRGGGGRRRPKEMDLMFFIVGSDE
jgi:exoribonuclease R